MLHPSHCSLKDANLMAWFWHEVWHFEIPSQTYFFFCSIFVAVFFFTSSWNLFIFTLEKKTHHLLNISASPFSNETNFAAIGTFNKLPPKSTCSIALIRSQSAELQESFLGFWNSLAIYNTSEVLLQLDLALFLYFFTAFVAVEKK